ncbi:MAG: 1,4-dihydroxy-6-naphthoate synthase [Rikenellaceae bacterium]|nr:1,4-dihydroxy-6-naphthoate synthase [Rikenellaceae bacterium]
MKLSLYISPCPNDTFMFDALVNGRIDTRGVEFDLHFADIEELNRAAERGEADITKVSYAVMPAVIDTYAVLDSGSALGRGNGPLLVSREPIDPNRPGLRVAVPGERTTANLLLSRLYPAITDKTPRLFSTIARSVADGEFDAGVLIHEGRFTYASLGLRRVADLGSLWEETTGTALPLGAIAVRRSLPPGTIRTVELLLRQSVHYAMTRPEASRAFVRSHAQEMDEQVMRSHIELFVNEFSLSLGEQGRLAASRLTGLAPQHLFTACRI